MAIPSIIVRKKQIIATWNQFLYIYFHLFLNETIILNIAK